MRTHILTLLALVLASRGALAQNEAALRAAFEGKMLTVKVDMPGTSQGIDVYPQESMPVNWREMAERMKEFGTSLKAGQQVMITKVVVKKDSHIEFQLGGGGYGTFGDFMSSSSSVDAVAEGESAEERRLREEIKQAQGPTRRKQLEKELANKRSERERENSRARAEAAQANEAREANLRIKRAQSGSRFNLRYKRGIPPFALTPEGVAQALAPYVDIAGMPVVAAAAAAAAPAVPSASLNGSSAPAPATAAGGAGTASGLAAMKKGLSVREVETLLGPASTANEVHEGALTVLKRTYAVDAKKVTASFVGGILIDFAITPL